MKPFLLIPVAAAIAAPAAAVSLRLDSGLTTGGLEYTAFTLAPEELDGGFDTIETIINATGGTFLADDDTGASLLAVGDDESSFSVLLTDPPRFGGKGLTEVGYIENAALLTSVSCEPREQQRLQRRVAARAGRLQLARRRLQRRHRPGEPLRQRDAGRRADQYVRHPDPRARHPSPSPPSAAWFCSAAAPPEAAPAGGEAPPPGGDAGRGFRCATRHPRTADLPALRRRRSAEAGGLFTRPEPDAREPPMRAGQSPPRPARVFRADPNPRDEPHAIARPHRLRAARRPRGMPRPRVRLHPHAAAQQRRRERRAPQRERRFPEPRRWRRRPLRHAGGPAARALDLRRPAHAHQRRQLPRRPRVQRQPERLPRRLGLLRRPAWSAASATTRSRWATTTSTSAPTCSPTSSPPASPPRARPSRSSPRTWTSPPSPRCRASSTAA